MSLFIKINVKYYLFGKVVNKALSRRKRNRKILCLTETYPRHFLSCIPDGGSSRRTSVVYWLYGFSAVLFSDHADRDHYGAGNDVYSKGRSSMCE